MKTGNYPRAHPHLYHPKDTYDHEVDKNRCRVAVMHIVGSWTRFQQCHFKARHFKEEIGLCTRHARGSGWLQEQAVVKWVGRIDAYNSGTSVVYLGKVKLSGIGAVYTVLDGDPQLVEYEMKLKKSRWEHRLHDSKKEAVTYIVACLESRVKNKQIALKDARELYKEWKAWKAKIK